MLDLFFLSQLCSVSCLCAVGYQCVTAVVTWLPVLCFSGAVFIRWRACGMLTVCLFTPSVDGEIEDRDVFFCLLSQKIISSLSLYNQVKVVYNYSRSLWARHCIRNKHLEHCALSNVHLQELAYSCNAWLEVHPLLCPIPILCLHFKCITTQFACFYKLTSHHVLETNLGDIECVGVK